MCGIVGFAGKQGGEQAAPILLGGLKKLEYRGYDSAGIAVRDDVSGETRIVKAKGRLAMLVSKTDEGRAVPGFCGIGHTRWATHGEPSELNAHPHTSEDGNVIGVHNGIIENYQELKAKLMRHNYTFYSETDTEVAIKLIDYYYKKYLHTPVDAINHALVRIRGSYALAVMFKDYPGEIYAARKDSPMIIGVTQNGSKDDGTYLASDVPAILSHTREVYYLGELQLARLTADGATFYNLDGDEISIEPTTIEWEADAAEKGGFEHFMMKEIHEQPKAIRDTLNAYLKEGQINLASESGSAPLDLSSVRRIGVAACGSAWHAAMAGKYVIEKLARIPVDVDLASEFRYRDPILDEYSLIAVVSQSGETADTLAALRLAKERGIPTLAIVNVVGSTIAREADYVLYTYAGPEIAVATTKAYSAQLIILYLLAVQAAYEKGIINLDRYSALIQSMQQIPNAVERTLDNKERIQWFAAKYSSAQNVYFIGRGLDYAICLEGSLKMKEITYIHSEGYAAGELKHGTISLIEPGTLVVGVLTQEDLYEKTISNLVEVKSRGAYLMGLTTFGHYDLEDSASFVVYVPGLDPLFNASTAIIPLQLMAYYLSLARGLDVDKPRNLAKSVTVE